MDTARVWALLYSRKGDNAQALAVARSLGFPIETKILRYTPLRALSGHLGRSLLALDRPSRALIRPPWPDAVVAIGRWSVPVARAIKRLSGGRTRIIFLGNPRISPRHFDLVVATLDYILPGAGNIVVAPLPMLDPPSRVQIERADRLQMAGLPRPRILLLVGGSVKYWSLTADDLTAAIAVLSESANRRGGSLAVSGSPRTPADLMDAVRQALPAALHGHIETSRDGGLAALLDQADEIFVTGDSMTMIAEAIYTGKPVGIIPLKLSADGVRKLGPAIATEGARTKRRDLRRFWVELWARHLAGTLARPLAAPLIMSTASFARVTALAQGLIQRPTDRAGAGTVRPYFGAWANPLAEGVRHSLGTMSLAARDSRTPWYSKMLAITSTILAVSPVDLTPDSIAGIGHLDDPILLVVGTILAFGSIPSAHRAEMRRRAIQADRGSADQGAVAIALLWAAAAIKFARLFF